jgi:hypothetical protein
MQTKQNYLDMNGFNAKNINCEQVKEQFQVDISNKLSTLENREKI